VRVAPRLGVITWLSRSGVNSWDRTISRVSLHPPCRSGSKLLRNVETVKSQRKSVKSQEQRSSTRRFAPFWPSFDRLTRFDPELWSWPVFISKRNLFSFDRVLPTWEITVVITIECTIILIENHLLPKE
jgi:hypothetical protein